MSDAPVFHRDELLGGLPARRAATLVFAIEARTARLVDRSRRALAIYETERTASEHERAFLQALAKARDLPIRVTVQDLERYASDWASLVPTEAGLRAAISHRIAEKYRLVERTGPRHPGALGLADPEVSRAYRRAFGRPIAAIFTADRLDGRERLRWLRATAIAPASRRCRPSGWRSRSP